ncbi:uncharacterized protein [Paramisgurnus dabryanus]|uniref:uncharacterized protein n=1 Tax=Paramisgurnus dabryanus TaxID=90735 RepID=UPI003CCFA7B6
MVNYFTQRIKQRIMKLYFLLLCFFVDGVVGDEVTSVSVMEGDSVTLQPDLIDIQTADRIVWIFGPGNDRIAQINRAANKISTYDDVLDGRFKDKLKLNTETGELTITNITTDLSEVYQLRIISGTDGLSRSFRIIVSSHLPVPDITGDCPQNSSSSENWRCVLLCSVLNVRDVSLSWYKGNSLLSSISVSDLNIRLSLPLEVEYQDTNTYRCVLNNTITNQTQQIDITHLCQPCSVRQSVLPEKQDHEILISVVVVFGVLIVVLVMFFCIYRNFRKPYGQTSGYKCIKLNGLCGADKMKTVTDGVKNITVKAGEDFTLDTGVTDIQTFYLTQWKFGELGDDTNPCIPISTIHKNKVLLNNVADQKLGSRLNLNEQTGSITIKKSKTTDTGLYKLEIKGNTNKICKSFFVTVSGS